MKTRSDKWFFGLIAASLVGVAIAVGAVMVVTSAKARAPLARFRQLEPFQLTERSGRTIEGKDLAGKIVVADFFFGSCSAECQILNQRMAEIQDLVAGADDVLLVSITVDPKSDTPEALTRYAAQLGASPTRWLFLTGKKSAIYPFIQQSFLLAVAAPDTTTLNTASGASFIHSDKIALVDRHGVVRAYYDGVAASTPRAVWRDIRKLRAEP